MGRRHSWLVRSRASHYGSIVRDGQLNGLVTASEGWILCRRYGSISPFRIGIAPLRAIPIAADSAGPRP